MKTIKEIVSETIQDYFGELSTATVIDGEDLDLLSTSITNALEKEGWVNVN